MSDAGQPLFRAVARHREVLAFGEASRPDATLQGIPSFQLPRSEATLATVASSDGHDQKFIESILERWRGATTSRDQTPNNPIMQERPLPKSVESPMLQPSMGLDPERFSLLKKPLR